MPQWDIQAFDNSEASFEYAKNLLAFFKCAHVGLRRELFPLEASEGLDQYRGRFGKVVVCELLEHLEKPAIALSNLRCVLHERGHLFLTMAVNIAQEDHVFLYSNIEQARCQVLEAGFKIKKELLAPVVILPFNEEERSALFRKGNYVCIVERN